MLNRKAFLNEFVCFSSVWEEQEEGGGEAREPIRREHRHLHRVLQAVWTHLVRRHVQHRHDQLREVSADTRAVRKKIEFKIKIHIRMHKFSFFREFMPKTVGLDPSPFTVRKPDESAKSVLGWVWETDL